MDRPLPTDRPPDAPDSARQAVHRHRTSIERSCKGPHKTPEVNQHSRRGPARRSLCTGATGPLWKGRTVASGASEDETARVRRAQFQTHHVDPALSKGDYHFAEINRSKLRNDNNWSPSLDLRALNAFYIFDERSQHG